MPFNNPYNYVRVSELQPVSIESLGIVITLGYFLYLVLRREASLEIAYFLALPFSDEPFRLASSVQPVEALSMLLVALNYKSIRLNYVILIGLLFVLFSVLGTATGSVHDSFSLLYSLKFLLIGLAVLRFDQAPLRAAGFGHAVCGGIRLLADMPASGALDRWVCRSTAVFYAGIFPAP